MKKDLNIVDLVSNTLKNNKQFNQLNKRIMNKVNDQMTDQEFHEWIERVTSNHEKNTDEINKQIEKEAGI